MRIGQISHLYRPSIGGIENYVHRLNEFLRGNGHEVTTFTTDLSYKNGNSPLDEAANAVYCSTTLTVLRNPFSLELHETVRTSNLDLYHLHSPYFLTTLEAAHALPNSKPVVMTVHGTLRNHSPAVKLLRSLYKPLANYVFRHTDHVFVLGENEKQRIVRRYGVKADDISVIPNGINIESFEVDVSTVEQFESKYGLSSNHPTVLYVSRLIPEKNAHVFVEAITQGLDGVDLNAILIGTGKNDYVDSLRSAADDRVQFLANLSDEELRAAYKSADVFVFLGTWEGLPTVLLEAMYNELPIVTTGVGEIPNYLGEENGTIIDSPPSPSTVANSIRRYLDYPEKAHRVGRRNKAYVQENHTWDEIAARMEQTYKEIVAP